MAATGTTPGSDAALQRWTLILGSLSSFLVGLDALVVTTALPTLYQEFGTGIEGLSWTVNAYELAFAASILTGSSLGDRFGRRLMFVVGIAVFTLSSAVCALSPNVETLIAARVVQGIGGGIAVPLALALITEVTPPQARGKALGIWGAFTGLAVAAGPLVGGAIVDGLAWQWIFWLNVPVGAIIAVLTLGKVIRGTRTEARFDPIGLVLATVGVFGVAAALIRGNAAGWDSPWVLTGLIGGVVVLVAFVLYERRTASPMMPMRLFGNRSFTGGCVAGFILMAGIFALGFLTAQYLQLALGRSPLSVGLGLLPATAVSLFIAPVTGRLADRIGEKPLIMLGLGLQALGLLLISALVTDTSGYGTIVGPLFVIGFGIAIAFPTVTTAVMRSVDPREAGIASGTSNTFRQVGAVFGVAIATAVFAGSGSYRTPAEFVSGFKPAFLVLGLLCVVGVGVGAMVRRHAATARPAGSPVPRHAG
ncbi:DHA2 family efflux MFS transporter permease subunit [Saccharothrix syringae]|uniref:DHA2 family efflux MFS transporter permease subunit n=1 Tax=Saccharothrix syringae TaxID=103733 RepID=A0A5Q0GXR3_SACSY|nr:DHA2 family efflux MFS transporter permease subunit [Saccharothrix syringae]QFZ18304.1 DHA2 family efflux MFS transporter permease subunit [Saccharothrix syringae]